MEIKCVVLRTKKQYQWGIIQGWMNEWMNGWEQGGKDGGMGTGYGRAILLWVFFRIVLVLVSCSILHTQNKTSKAENCFPWWWWEWSGNKGHKQTAQMLTFFWLLRNLKNNLWNGNLHNLEFYSFLIPGNLWIDIQVFVWSRGGGLHQNWICWHLDLGLPSPQNCEKWTVVYKPSSLWYFVTEAWLD